MDWSLILGIAGIAVSVIVGWLTYYLADKRQRRSRFLAAKHTVVSTLSRSLSEETIPTVDLVRATIRSVLREENADLSRISVDEVIDDLIRQVSSDPFLAAERRKELQASLLALVAPSAAVPLGEADERRTQEAPPVIGFRMTMSWASLALGVMAALLTFLTLGNVFARLPESSGPNPSNDSSTARVWEYFRRGDLQSHLDSVLVLILFAAVMVTVAYLVGRRKDLG